MPRPPLTVALALLVAAGSTGHARVARAEKFTLATLPYQPSWCAEETESLAENICHVHGTPSPDGRRTLVIYLHGVIAKNTMWQWLQERNVARVAKQLHFDAIVPRAPAGGRHGERTFAWPSFRGRDAVDEEALAEEWVNARRKLEERNGALFDEVYVLGFSSGAYFASSLALRAKLAVDGYVVLAGGAASEPSAEATGDARVPVFVGVCLQDRASAPEARELGRVLAARGWPVRVDEQQVGHEVSDLHVAHALRWFRTSRGRRDGGLLRTPSVAR